MTKYAEGTEVSSERSLSEIRTVLNRFGAKRFGYAEEAGWVGITFEIQTRMVRFVIHIPTLAEFERTPARRHRRSAAEQLKVHDQAVRQRYRALLLVIKAKLESVESGIETFDEAFMGQMVLPSGETMATWAGPQLEQAYKTGAMPQLLALPSGKVSNDA